jgi:hypothetical protein
VHKDTLGLLHGTLNELENLLRRILATLFVIEEILVLLIKPVELEVDHSDGLPVVGNLSARAIDYMADLVSHDKFKVLPSS